MRQIPRSGRDTGPPLCVAGFEIVSTTGKSDSTTFLFASYFTTGESGLLSQDATATIVVNVTGQFAPGCSTKDSCTFRIALDATPDLSGTFWSGDLKESCCPELDEYLKIYFNKLNPVGCQIETYSVSDKKTSKEKCSSVVLRNDGSISIRSPSWRIDGSVTKDTMSVTATVFSQGGSKSWDTHLSR